MFAVDDRTAEAWIEVLNGATRTVVLVGRYAYKLPSLRYGWRAFLRGLLANMQEREWSAAGYDGLCPVTFSIPGGFLVVMPRTDVVTNLTDEAYAEFMSRAVDCVLPVENKEDSFGWLNDSSGDTQGRLVAIDYG